MSALESVENTVYLGIDGGGSKCKAVLANASGEIIGTGSGGPANPLQGYPQAINSILDAAQQALASSQRPELKLNNIIAGVGLAGVNLPDPFQQMSQWQHPFARFYLTTDLEIANLGAHQGEDGAVIIVGTGSCGYRNLAGKKTSLGGHGFPIGDKASGAWIGLEAVKHTLLVLDGFIAESNLSASVCRFFAVDNGLALSEKLAGRSSCEFAKLARLVFEAADLNDRVACTIVNEAVDYISRLLRLLGGENCRRISMIGGLAKFILPRLPQQEQSLFVSPIQQPEFGALTFARRCWLSEQPADTH